MAEHVHEWKMFFPIIVDREREIVVASCLVEGCKEERDWEWVERRINATERLSALDAKMARYGYQYEDVDKALTAYADIREEKP